MQASDLFLPSISHHLTLEPLKARDPHFSHLKCAAPTGSELFGRLNVNKGKNFSLGFAFVLLSYHVIIKILVVS